MNKDEALKLALDFIENSECGTADLEAHVKEALAQPEQEPVAWEQFYPDMGKPKLVYLSPTESSENACLTPPQRTWVGLTDEELQPIADEYRILFGSWVKDFAQAIEAKLKEKNA
jgi:hypothetical protein